MKKITLTFLIFTAVFTLSLLNETYSQSKTGTTIGQFLKIEPSARLAAMGNAGSASSGEVISLFYNPASLGLLQRTDIQFTYNKWLADITYNYAAIGINFADIGTLALQVTSLNSGEISVRTVDLPEGTGEKYTVNDFSIGLGYGLMLTDRVSVGFQINYITENIWHSSLATFGLNFGVQYRLYEGGPTLGASVSNFGPAAKYDGRDLFFDYDINPRVYGDNNKLPSEFRTDSYSLPTIYRAGISFPFNFGDDYKFLIAADAIHPNDNFESINIGGEFTLLKLFSIRGGYRNLFLEDSEGGLVLGSGVNMNILQSYNIRFDYAWADYGRLNEVHRITVSMNL
ncbi:MAG TPA: PorV/PorQ family protein [Ignavibacteriaceae bacterium]|nr:PorV/PorQ family protein [Ignavibacteriaceae bacterium]